MSSPSDDVDAEFDDFRDLTEAAESSVGFWDNSLDDEDWGQQS